MNLTLATIYEYTRSPHGIPEENLVRAPEYLRSLDVDLGNYRNEISRLENQLQSLRARQESAQKKAAALRSLFAPIRRLPNELLIHIFDYVCDNAPNPRWYELSDAPFSLSAVCSRWRSLCLSHPKMWSKLAVNCNKGSKIGTAVDLYLERSKHQLLTLRLAYYPEDDNQVGHEAIFQKLLNCCARWRHVMLSLQYLSAEFPRLAGLDFPALESLNFYNIRRGLGELGIFARSPKLLELDTQTSFIPNQDVLGRITKLSYTVDFGNLREVLRLCSKLHALVIFENYRETDIRDPPIVIPTLTSLRVDGEQEYEGTFRSLTTPALTTLEITRWFPVGDVALWHIEQFLDRSGCPLTSLRIEAYWTDETVITLLRRLPSLQELAVFDCWIPRNHSSDFRKQPITKVFVESLHRYRQSHLPIVPKLRSLSLKVASTGFDHESFVDMIMSRWIPNIDSAASTGVSCIQSVQLSLPECIDEAEYLPLVCLKKEGMCFDLQMAV